ncbi:hypothetical protein SNE40_022527 [Patella caerulea]|uniref:Ubiquitin carboxyl-terminal hydrolase n=1 Tax=Patella caerulea TaxID=87958 RepID=A0AAN8FWK8_PATCE
MHGVRFKGQVKYSGINSGNSNWKSGSIEITNNSGSWICNLYFDCNSKEKPVRGYKISAKNIVHTIYKNRFVLELKQIHFHFKPTENTSDGCIDQIKAIMNEVLGDRADENGILRTPELKRNYHSTPNKTLPYIFNSSNNLSNVDMIDMIDNTENNPPDVLAKSSHVLNGEGIESGDDFEEAKENKYRGPTSAFTPEQFLKRGSEKSRETLKSITAGGFYSSSAVKQSTPMLTLNGCSSKRSLGFMPDPTPVKKMRLSDCNYSWVKNKSTPKIEINKTSSLHGFSNLGNTCYMNATLQSLFGLDTFSTDLIHTNRHLMQKLSQDSLYYHLAKLLKARRNTNLPDSQRRDFLRNVKRAISTSAKRFSGYQQHDAHEFLGQVLDQLKEEVMKIEKLKNVSTPPKELNNNNRLTNNDDDIINPTVQNFEFEVHHSIQCLQCDEEVEKIEQFNDLSLDMPKRYNSMGSRSIQDALNVFLDKEKIEYLCSKCGHDKSEVTHRFKTLPRILVLQLKRNRYDSVASKNGKVIQGIRIPKLLSLGYFCNEDTVPCKSVPNFIPNIRFRKLSQNNDSNSRIDDELPPLPDFDEILKDKTEDEDIAKAIELSLAQQKQPNDENEETEEEQLAKVLELSRREGQKDTTELNSFCSDPELEKLTEDERIEMAIQQSLMLVEEEENKHNTSTDDLQTSNNNSFNGEVDLRCFEDKENLFDLEICPTAEQENEREREYRFKKFETDRDFPFSSYRLVSIVNHIGSSSSAGHYISDVFDLKKQSWSSFDDARVTPMSETEVCNRREKSGYIFFYMNKTIFEEMTRMYSTASITDTS